MNEKHQQTLETPTTENNFSTHHLIPYTNISLRILLEGHGFGGDSSTLRGDGGNLIYMDIAIINCISYDNLYTITCIALCSRGGCKQIMFPISSKRSCKWSQQLLFIPFH